MTMTFNKDALRRSAETIDEGDVLTLGPNDGMAAGVSWDVSSREMSGARGKASKRIGCDLDAGATLLQNGEPVLMAWMDNLDPAKDRSITHTGDNTTGDGEGDDETVEIPRFGDIAPEFDEVIFFVANFKPTKLTAKLLTGGKEDIGFHGAENVKMTLYTHDAATNEHGAFSIRPSLLNDDNVCLVARASRVTKGDRNSSWEIRRIGKMTRVPKGDKRALLRAAIAAR